MRCFKLHEMWYGNWNSLEAHQTVWNYIHRSCCNWHIFVPQELSSIKCLVKSGVFTLGYICSYVLQFHLAHTTKLPPAADQNSGASTCLCDGPLCSSDIDYSVKIILSLNPDITKTKFKWTASCYFCLESLSAAYSLLWWSSHWLAFVIIKLNSHSSFVCLTKSWLWINSPIPMQYFYEEGMWSVGFRELLCNVVWCNTLLKIVMLLIMNEFY